MTIIHEAITTEVSTIKELSTEELDAVAGGLEAKDIILLKWINANFPSLMPSVFTHSTRNIC
jgi:bacteriocin-like protein